MDNYDAVVIGAGFGGLGAALTLAETGRRVLVLEALRYPGGCASTFDKGGFRFDAGATMLAGLAPGQLLRGWLDRYAQSPDIVPLDPVLELRHGSERLVVPSSREALLETFCAVAGAPVAGLRRFFAIQQACAEATWPLFDDPELLPPVSWDRWSTHLARLPIYLPVVRWVGRSVGDVLRHCGLADFVPIWRWADASCQITVQTTAEAAEAPFALGALDFFFRGACSIAGGPGALANALVECVEAAGGEVRFARRVRGMVRVDGTWRLDVRGDEVRAPVVVANLLPQALERLLGHAPPRTAAQADAVATGWGAAMLYLAVDPARVETSGPHHLHLRPDPGQPPVEGHGVLASVSGADEDRGGARVVTVSTHVDAQRAAGADGGEYIAAVHERMWAALERYTPHLAWGSIESHTASPRTFARFTGRPLGLVGGVPRVQGLVHYRDAWPRAVAPGLYLCGDTTFPGQSTLAAAVGGVTAARAAS